MDGRLAVWDVAAVDIGEARHGKSSLIALMYVRNTLKLKELQPDCEELLDFLDRLGDGQQDHSVLRLHHGIPARNYDLALSDDGADYDTGRQQIGRASCRERVCQTV